MLTLTVYSLETGKVVQRYQGQSNDTLEAAAQRQWGSNEYGWTYNSVFGDRVALVGERTMADTCADLWNNGKPGTVTHCSVCGEDTSAPSPYGEHACSRR